MYLHRIGLAMILCLIEVFDSASDGVLVKLDFYEVLVALWCWFVVHGSFVALCCSVKFDGAFGGYCQNCLKNFNVCVRLSLLQSRPLQTFHSF